MLKAGRKKKSTAKYTIREASVKDVREIQKLINKFASKNAMLPRSLNEIYESLRDYIICLNGDKIIGVAAIHILWEDLAEVRSIAVSKDYQGKGIGKRLVRRCLKQAKSVGIERVFALTYFPDFFKNLGFKNIDKNDLPHKIWGDCLKCPRFPDCDEEAMLKVMNE